MTVRVPLQFVKPTMRLARPIADGEGKLVAGAGTLLRDGVVRVLRTMAVQSVLVEGDDLPGWETVRPLDQELRELASRFGPGALEGPRADLHAAIARHLTARAARLGAEEPEG
jgi:hypothetical protein